MLARLARTSYRHRRLVVVGWLLALVVITVVARNAGSTWTQSSRLSGTDSQAATDLLKTRFPSQGGSSADIVFKAAAGVTDPATEGRLKQLFAQVAKVPQVAEVASPYAPGGARQISANGAIGYAEVNLSVDRRAVTTATKDQLKKLVSEANGGGLQVEGGGDPFAGGAKLASTELIGIAAAIVILLLAFGSLLAMGLPILTALVGIGIGFAVVGLLSHVASVPDFATQLAAMIGLGVGIDYALFIVTRYRQGLHQGLDPETAVVAALDTAGRAVFFAGTTVVIALLGMLLIGISFVGGLGVTAAAVVAVTMAASVTVLPALPRPAGPDDVSVDPDASWGHRNTNTPGTKDGLFFGYYAQAVTTVADEGGPPVPELVRRVSLDAPSVDPPTTMAAVLARLHAAGTAVADVLADSGYAHRVAGRWAEPLRHLGARLVQDLHPHDRGPKGTFEGAILANGNLYCPATPAPLLALGPLARGATGDDIAAHDRQCAELARYKLGRISTDDTDDYHRVECPAAAGKLRCPLKPASMAAGFDHPEILDPPTHPPRCCAQATITVPPSINAKTRQKHDYPSAAHRRSYARRTGAERTFSTTKDPATTNTRRGWSRLMGRTKNLLLYACANVIRNLRILAGFERRQADNARRAAAGQPPRTRRRRRQTTTG